jgi:hypothetical protein
VAQCSLKFLDLLSPPPECCDNHLASPGSWKAGFSSFKHEFASTVLIIYLVQILNIQLYIYIYTHNILSSIYYI